MSQGKMRITATGMAMIAARDDGRTKRAQVRREWAVKKCTEITQKMQDNESGDIEIELLRMNTDAVVEKSEDDLLMAALEEIIGVPLGQLVKVKKVEQLDLSASKPYQLVVFLGDLYNALKAAVAMADSDPVSSR